MWILDTKKKTASNTKRLKKLYFFTMHDSNSHTSLYSMLRQQSLRDESVSHLKMLITQLSSNLFGEAPFIFGFSEQYNLIANPGS